MVKRIRNKRRPSLARTILDITKEIEPGFQEEYVDDVDDPYEVEDQLALHFQKQQVESVGHISNLPVDYMGISQRLAGRIVHFVVGEKFLRDHPSVKPGSLKK